MLKTYDVALWRYRFDYNCLPEHVEEIEADSPFLAVLKLMGKYKLRSMMHAAARAFGEKTIHRYDGLAFKVTYGYDQLPQEEVL